MNDIKTMPKIGAEDLRSLAGVIARTKKAARETGGKERRKTG